jgi:hypothetical protein
VPLDKGISLAESKSLTITANAYLGCRGIVKALEEGADIVVGGRIADASLTIGPAAWWHGWRGDDWDRLAGAATAGHIIECGAQATGGNYSFIDEVPSFRNVGFPIAEIFPDGSFVITKHPGTGGLVSVDTVKAQLLYEIGEPRYITPDVIARFDTIEISSNGPDRVHIRGVKGEPPTRSTKVCINTLAGYRNSMTVILTGLDIEKKARIVEDALFDAVGGKDQYRTCDVHLIRSDKEDPVTNEEAFAYLRITVIDDDRKKVDRLSGKVVELALANIPGFAGTAPPSKGSPAIVYWPALISNSQISQTVIMGGMEYEVESVVPPDTFTPARSAAAHAVEAPGGVTVRTPFGRAFATRSGDKGGNANLGVWAKSPEGYAFLRDFLTTKMLRVLLSDLDRFTIERYELPNLLAVNFVIRGILGEGAAASVRLDAQAKTLGEYLRAKIVDLPSCLVS